MTQKFGAGVRYRYICTPADLMRDSPIAQQSGRQGGTHCVARLLSLLARECPDYDCQTDVAIMPATRQPLKIVFTLGALLWASASLSNPLLPSQEEPNFFNVRICRDRQVLSALKTAAASTLRTKVIIANGSGPDWSGYEPDDIHLEAVSLSLNKNEVFCSVTISAKGIIERIVYVVSTTSDSWVVRFGGTTGSELGGHKLFPRGPITVEPTSAK